MIYWMKRRIERSRVRCHKAHAAHKQSERSASHETKQEHETKAASRIRTSPARHK
jgi:hypothetical protein